MNITKRRHQSQKYRNNLLLATLKLLSKEPNHYEKEIHITESNVYVFVFTLVTLSHAVFQQSVQCEFVSYCDSTNTQTTCFECNIRFYLCSN